MTATAATTDQVLLRRFGLVRAAGGAAYGLVTVVLLAVVGGEALPLALGVVVLAVVTTDFWYRSRRAPALSVRISLVADAVVLAGTIAYLGGTSSGLIGLYSIVIVSAGILLGTGAAVGFTALVAALSLLELLAEQLGYTPALLYQPDLGTRATVLLVALAGLLSVGYLTASYAGRLHALIAEAGAEAEGVRRRGRRRRHLVAQASLAVREPLGAIERVAEALERDWDGRSEEDRRALTAELRVALTQLDAEVGQLADVGVLDVAREARPEPLLLRRVVEDAVVALGPRLAPYTVDVEIDGERGLGEPRAARRIVFNLLENVVAHTPPGTTVTVRVRVTAGQAVLVIADDGPGIPPKVAATMFAPPSVDGPRVGLPLVRALAEAIGAVVRHEQPSGGGARYLVAFRLAPRSAPSREDPQDLSVSTTIAERAEP